MRMATLSASARLGSRAHKPRLANSGMWSVTSVKPVPAPVARSAGQPARFLPAMHSSRRRRSRRKSARLLQALAAELQAGMHIHAQGRLRAAQRAGLVEVDRLVGRLHDPHGRNAEAVAQRLFDRFHALVQDVEIDARHLRPETDSNIPSGRRSEQDRPCSRSRNRPRARRNPRHCRRSTSAPRRSIACADAAGTRLW